MNLYEVEKDKNYKILNCPEVSVLNSLGVFNGSNVFKKETYKMGGPVLVLVDLREVAIGKDIAVEIEVEEVNSNVEKM